MSALPVLPEYLKAATLPKGTLIFVACYFPPGGASDTRDFFMAADEDRESLMEMLTGLAAYRVWLTVFQPTSQDGYQAATALFNDGAWFSIPTSFIEEHRDEVDTLGITACPAIDFHATFLDAFPQAPVEPLECSSIQTFHAA